MKSMCVSLMVLMLVVGLLAVSVHAVLIDRGGGMIYSTELNVTWLQDANYAKTSGYDADGLMTWDEAMNWAAQLNYGGYTDWRLPTFDPAHQRDDATPLNEMAYVLYTELGNNYGGEPYTYGPFTNVLTDDNPDGVRWSSLEYDPGNAWNFYFTCG